MTAVRKACGPPENVPTSIVGGKSVTRCVYFPDRALIERLNKALGNYPRTSLSNLILQVLEQVAPKLEELTVQDHSVELSVKIWL